MLKQCQLLLLRESFVALVALLLVTVVLLSNLAAVAFNLSHYQEQYRLLEVSRATGMTEEELLRVTREVLAYLKGERQDLDLVAQIHNQESPLFTSRELAHMADVRNLFARGFLVQRGGFFLLALLLFLGTIGDKGCKPLEKLLFILHRAALEAILALALLGLIILANFDYWFTIFHHFSFANDFWLLDPARHNLIKMYPQAFFYNTTWNFVGCSIIQLVVLAAASGWFLRKKGKVRDDLRAGTSRIL